MSAAKLILKGNWSQLNRKINDILVKPLKKIFKK